MINRRTLLGAAGASPLIWTTAFRPVFAETPKDTVVMAHQIDDIISLDPQESFEFSGNEVTGNIYQKLIVPDTTDPTKIRPELAERWETSPDGLTTTFHLAQGRKFASGNPVTAEDVVFTLTRAVAMNKAPAFIINQFGFTKENVAERITAPDPQTVVIKIAEPQSPTFLLYCLSANVGGIVDKKTVMSHVQGDDWGNAWLKQNSAGSGAWSLRSWRANEAVALDANPNSPDAPKLKRLLILHRNDPSAQFLALQRGDVDIARTLSPEQLKQLQEDPNYTLVSAVKASLNYLAMNQKNANLAKPQVRQAIKWAIDYQQIAKNITPNVYVAHQAFLPKGLPGALTDLPFQKDVDKAKGLLKEAGLEGGFAVTLDHQSGAPHGDIAQAVQADLGAIGIKVQLVAGDNRQVITKTRARQHELAMLRWGSDYMDPHSNAETFCMNPDNGDNARNRTVAWRSSWQDEDLTKRAIANVKEQDADKRVREYERMQRDHQERSAFAIMLQQVEVAAMRKGVSSFEIGPLSDRSVYAHITKA
ncbi:MAG TPA: ABC transporter substrate-binding protein [Acetobacteraceae bacterium]|nr:ABC transporter substrate-binding protein [Acetobacteraceae bacterium]